MKSDPENFDRLLKLLALKRHEQPPPGYFDNFSLEVMARLKAGEARKRSWWNDIVDEAPWLRPIWSAFEAKPILAGAFGVVVCGLVLSGIIYSQKLDQTSVTYNPNLSESLFTGAPKTWALDQPAPTMMASTNPVIDPQIPGSVFDMFRPVPQPVNFNP